MKKLMISQPMVGKTEEEIIIARDKAIAFARRNNIEFVNTKFTDEWYSQEQMNERGVVHIPLCFLAKSLEMMSRCDFAWFAQGWEDARGCRVEHEVATAYGVHILYEEGLFD